LKPRQDLGIQIKPAYDTPTQTAHSIWNS